MQRSFFQLRWIVAVAWIGLATATFARTPWLVRTGLLDTQMPAELAKWTAPPYNLQPVCLTGYELSGTARISALYAQPSDNLAVLTAVAVNDVSLSLLNSQRQANGYRLIWLNGYGSGTAARYNAIWKQTNGAAQRIRLGQTLAEHQADDATMQSEGYHLYGISTYTVNNGVAAQHAAWWDYTPIASAQTDVVYSETGAQYQSAFNAHPASSGWRLISVSGHTILGTERFTAMFRKPAGAPWYSLNGLTSTNYDSANLNAHYTGFRPVFLHNYPLGSAVKASVVWEEDGGLPAANTGSIGAAVRDYMTTNARPGLSLAITRRGHLVYASGFGYADTSTGEIVGPRHRFRIASVSKPVTAVTVLRALEQYPGTLESFVFGTGALLANDFGTPPYTTNQKAIRVRNLLTHTSGWVNDGMLWYDAQPSWGSDNVPAIGWQLDSGFQAAAPGAVAKYTNINFVTAARIAAKLSGQTYENYAKNEILATCGVTDMAIGNRRKADRQTREVTYYPDDANQGGEDQGPYLIDPRRMDGSTAWIAKPMDMLLFARRMDDNTIYTDILSQASMDAMRTPSGAPPYQGDAGMNPDTYGLGWSSTPNPITFWSHNGSMDGTAANLITRLDGVSWFYAANSRAGGDTYSSNFTNLVNGLIDDLNTANAWPDNNYDLYPTVNNEFDTWRDQYFTALDQSQPGLQPAVWGFGADPDGDGLPNAAEAYLGRDPTVADRSPFTVLRNGSILTVRWQRSLTDYQIVPSIETSTNLSTWLVPIGVTINPRNDLIAEVGHRWEEITVNMTSARRFYRLSFVAR